MGIAVFSNTHCFTDKEWKIMNDVEKLSQAFNHLVSLHKNKKTNDKEERRNLERAKLAVDALLVDTELQLCLDEEYYYWQIVERR